ncbi:MAG: PD-(D/E)XK nuclease-like domain-containing protein [Hyphomicrobiales bacterium]
MTEKIAENGIYNNISLERYHNDLKLFDGPNISKSALKYVLPPHGGSPKKFWGHWKWNPNHVETKTTAALNFGKLVRRLLLGDEVFAESFVVQPTLVKGKAWHSNRTACKELLLEQAAAGLTFVNEEQIERVRRMAADAEQYPLIRDAGLLNGKVEQSMFTKDPSTGIWLKSRPDNEPAFLDGVYTDLKSASSLDEDFVQRQLFDAGYYLQGAATRMNCQQLNRPFESFVFVYVLNAEVPDTSHVELSPHEIDRGERAIHWCLVPIRHGLDTGNWPGHQHFKDGTIPIQSKFGTADKLDNFPREQDHLSNQLWRLPNERHSENRPINSAT